MSYAVSARYSSNRRTLPSGEIETGRWFNGPVNNRSVDPLPSAAWRATLRASTGPVENTIERPSGVHIGLVEVGSKATRVRMRRPRSHVQMLSRSSGTANGARESSGETRAVVYRRGGLCGGFTRRVRVTHTSDRPDPPLAGRYASVPRRDSVK